jgi:hypothetical protein
MTAFVSSTKETVFVDICTKTLRTNLEPVRLVQEFEFEGFFSGRKQDSHYENESNVLLRYSESQNIIDVAFEDAPMLALYIHTYIHTHTYVRA